MNVGVQTRAKSTLKFKTDTGGSLTWEYPANFEFTAITKELIAHAIAWGGEGMREYLADVVKKSNRIHEGVMRKTTPGQCNSLTCWCQD